MGGQIETKEECLLSGLTLNKREKQWGHNIIYTQKNKDDNDRQVSKEIHTLRPTMASKIRSSSGKDQ